MSTEYDNEVWIHVRGFEGIYQISNEGRVRSLDRERYCGAGKTIKLKGGYLLLNKRKDGYRWVTLRGKSKQRMVLVHHLVLENFVGPRPFGMCCRHRDGNPSNNQLTNLIWGTQKENVNDQRLHGTMAYGENRYNARFTWMTVRKIRDLYNTEKYTQKELAQVFGTIQATISKIVRNEIWKEEYAPST